MPRRLVILVVLGIFELMGNARGSWTYIGPAYGDWDNPNNWCPYGIPQRGEDNWYGAYNVYIDGPVSVTGADADIDTLGIGQGTALQIDGQLFMAGDIEDSGRISQSGGTVFLHPGLTLSAGSFYGLSGSSILEDSYEDIYGTFSQLSGTHDLYRVSASHNFVNIYLGASYVLTSGTLMTMQMSNAGDFSIDTDPGSAPNPSVSIASFNQSSRGELSLFDLTPTSAPILNFSDSATVGGTLQVEFDPSYLPRVGDDFILIQSPTLTGTFATYELPELSEGFYFQPEYTPTGFSLVVLPEPAVAVICGSMLLFRMKRRPKNEIELGRFIKT